MSAVLDSRKSTRVSTMTATTISSYLTHSLRHSTWLQLAAGQRLHRGKWTALRERCRKWTVWITWRQTSRRRRCRRWWWLRMSQNPSVYCRRIWRRPQQECLPTTAARWQLLPRHRSHGKTLCWQSTENTKITSRHCKHSTIVRYLTGAQKVTRSVHERDKIKARLFRTITVNTMTVLLACNQKLRWKVSVKWFLKIGEGT